MCCVKGEEMRIKDWPLFEIAITVLAVLIGARLAFGEEINILVCKGTAPNALNRAEALDVYRRAEFKIRSELNVKLKRTSLTVKSCRLASDYRKLYSGVLFGKALSYIPRQHVKKNRINLAIIPGITFEERVGMGGVASDVCRESDWNLAIAAIPRYNSNGFDGLDFGPVAIAHELGHIMGCYHQPENCNTMHPDPLRQQLNCGITRFLPRSFVEVRECRQLVRAGL